jgi:hypothetical protein
VSGADGDRTDDGRTTGTPTAANDRSDRPPASRRLQSAILWGLVGGFSFLVLAQGYRLVTGRGPRLLALLGVAVVVTAVAAGLSYALEVRLHRLG